jgi:hypothetical protein
MKRYRPGHAQHERALRRPRLDQSVHPQLADRASHRRSTQPGPLHQNLLRRQPITNLQPALPNLITQLATSQRQ